MLNVKQVIDEGLLLLEHTQGKPAQVGYDLSLKAVQKIGTRIGYNIFNDNAIGKVLKNKTELTKYTPKSTIMLDGVEGWILHEGVYDITFNEGCKIDEIEWHNSEGNAFSDVKKVNLLIEWLVTEKNFNRERIKKQLSKIIKL